MRRIGLLLLIVFCLGGAARAADPYDLITLEILPGASKNPEFWNIAWANAMNNKGEVVGASWDNEDGDPIRKPVYWGLRNNYAPRNIFGKELPGWMGQALGINDGSYVVGEMNYSGYLNAFLWQAASGQRWNLSFTCTAWANSINIHGLAAGAIVSEYGYDHTLASLFELNKLPLAITEASPTTTAEALSINDANQMVGYERSSRTGDKKHACFWEKQGDAWVWQDLDQGWAESQANAINNRGEVTGYYEHSDGLRRAFIWDKVKGMRTIPTPPGHATEGWAINGNGHIVGTAYYPDLSSYAFIWLHGDQEIIDLNLFRPLNMWGVCYLDRATGINDRFEIVFNGTKKYPDGRCLTRGFLLRPKTLPPLPGPATVGARNSLLLAPHD